jgi:hypothetical protein
MSMDEKQRAIVDRLIPQKITEGRNVAVNGKGLCFNIPTKISEFYQLEKGTFFDFNIKDETTLIIKIRKDI